MMQRTVAALVSLALLAALLVATAFVHLPYVEYSPGPTVDVLGSEDGQEIIEISGHREYRDDGQLRLTTVYVTPPGGINLYEAMAAWADDDRAVVPEEGVYPDNQTPEDADEESAAQMVSSQDAAIASALRELGYKLKQRVVVQSTTDGMPADDVLRVRDVIVSVGGERVRTAADVAEQVQSHAVGTPLEFEILREDKRETVSITPVSADGTPMVGVLAGPGFDFPFAVDVNLSDDIGGPSAGLMFALAIYDTLTPGSMTDGASIAGTGTIDPGGNVGPIGGIAQKIVGAREAGAQLFLVPRDNCREALQADNESMTLVRADTMADAVSAVEAWGDGQEGDLPTCEQWIDSQKEQTQ